MSRLVLHLRAHLPVRLRRYRFLDVGERCDYFDEPGNERLAREAAAHALLPACRAVMRAIERTGGRFACALAPSGTLLGLLEAFAPEVLEAFAALARTGRVELAGTSSDDARAPLDDPLVQEEQARQQRERLQRLLGVAPVTFHDPAPAGAGLAARAARLEALGFAVLSAGAADDPAASGARPRRLSRPAGCRRLVLLLRDGGPVAPGAPPAPPVPLAHLAPLAPLAPLETEAEAPVDAALALELGAGTDGERARAALGRLAASGAGFVLPRELAGPGGRAASPGAGAPGPMGAPARTAPGPARPGWVEDPLQAAALAALRELGPDARRAARRGRPELLEAWRTLSGSDHLRAMSIGGSSEGPSGRARPTGDPTPPDSPHEAFIAYLNVLDDLSERIAAALRPKRAKASAGTAGLAQG